MHLSGGLHFISSMFFCIHSVFLTVRFFFAFASLLLRLALLFTLLFPLAASESDAGPPSLSLPPDSTASSFAMMPASSNAPEHTRSRWKPLSPPCGEPAPGGELNRLPKPGLQAGPGGLLPLTESRGPHCSDIRFRLTVSTAGGPLLLASSMWGLCLKF